MTSNRRTIIEICMAVVILFLLAGMILLLIHFDVFERLGARLDKDAVHVPILMYHHFADEGTIGTTVSAELFENQIKALRDEGYTAISFDELCDYVFNGTSLPKRPIIITMDDGYESVYETAYPILKKYDMKATVFIIGVSHGKSVYKDTQYSIIPHLTDAEAMEMVESGVMSIQSHSYDMHQYEPYETGTYRVGVQQLDGESDAEYVEAFTADFERASAQIQSISGKKPFVYSYPFGKSNKISENLLKDMGVTVTLTITEGINTIDKDSPECLLLLKRYNVPGDMSPEKLVKKIAG